MSILFGLLLVFLNGGDASAYQLTTIGDPDTTPIIVDALEPGDPDTTPIIVDNSGN